MCTGSFPEDILFVLDKWYLDLVDEHGTALIGYAARIHAGPLSAGYASCLISPPNGSPTDRTTIRDVRFPETDGPRLTWVCGSLDLEGEWTAAATPVARTLLESSAGTIEWNCLLPRGSARVRQSQTTIAGHGYAERLRLTVPPAHLPFRTLRWGRHVSDRHSVVWIEWEGATDHRSIWLDGIEQPEARLGPTGMLGLEGGRSLRFSDSRTLRDRAVLGAVGEALPDFARRLAGPLGTMREPKLLDRSSLVSGDQPLDLGWAIHEEVTW